MPELESAREKFPEVYQRGLGWCIPAAIEVVIHHFGVDAITQEDMVYEYHENFGDSGFCTLERQPVQFRSTGRAVVIETARGLLLPRANFDIFADIARERCAAADQPFEFIHPPDSNNFPGNIKSAVDDGFGFLMACLLPNGDFHIWAVIGYEDDIIHAYDPATRQTESKTAADFYVNYDSLVIRPD
jgi:hypothetical protein